ncbi:glutamate ligase domain-containing protein [Nannocystis pusilla]|uniref:glutamate ligase domain-containing protein n=1 Tax=Nannocystis pusilla TaxID=889268 RepID=UPI003B81E95F
MPRSAGPARAGHRGGRRRAGGAGGLRAHAGRGGAGAASGAAACSGRLFVVLGCGGDRDPSKRAPMGEFAATLADRFYATSDNPRTEDPEAIVAQMLAGVPPARRDRVVPLVDRRAAIARAVADADADDVVVIAGKGHEDYQIVGTTKLHFDDREEAAAALRLRASASRASM